MLPPRPPEVGRLRHFVNKKIRDPLPVLPFEEQVDRFLQRDALRADTVVEDREVARFLAAHGPVPPAHVVTIVATFKRRELVARAVRSALAQTGIEDQRIIVIDDGAGEIDLIPSDPRVTVISLEANTHNAGLVRNVGLRVSSSPFIAFLDDDNQWDPTHLSECLAALDAGAELVYTGVLVVDEDDVQIDEWSDPWNSYRMRVTNYIDLNAIAARRNGAAGKACGPDGLLLSRLRRRPRSPRYEDWELVWRVSRRGKIVHLPESTVRYRLSVASNFRGAVRLGG